MFKCKYFKFSDIHTLWAIFIQICNILQLWENLFYHFFSKSLSSGSFLLGQILFACFISKIDFLCSSIFQFILESFSSVS